MSEFYTTSKGEQKRIADMPHPYLQSALNKLIRERDGDDRQDEVDAMSAQLAKLDEEYLESQVGQ